MDTQQLHQTTTRRWFAGLRRSRSRVLGGVAAGFADFWAVDPVLVRVLVASPFLATVLAIVSQLWLAAFIGWSAATLLWQVLSLASAGVVLGYLLAWILIPRGGEDSLARRFVSLDGAVGTLVKLVVGAVFLIALGWLGLAALFLVSGNLTGQLGLPMLMLWVVLGVTGLAVVTAWVRRGGDLRDAVRRFGSPGFGRTEPVTPTTWATPGFPDGDPTVVLPESTEATGTMVPTDPPDGIDPTVTLPTPADPDAPEPVDGPQDSVDRARAAATAAADARAAAAEASRRARAAEARARRAAARAVRRERNRWGRLVAAATLIAAGVLALTDRLGSTDLGGLGIGVVCLALMTGGVLVGAWFGSARWLIAPALLLAAVLSVASVGSAILDDAASAPPISVAPKTLPADQEAMMHWGTGTVTVDLTKTRALDARQLAVEVGRGSLTVIIPADQWASVISSVTVGRNNLADPPINPFSSDYRELNGPADTSQEPETLPLYLYLHVDIGELTVIEKEA